MMRAQLLQLTEAISPCLIGIGACTGAFHWQRHFESQGHTVKIIAPQYVKPFLKDQKNDGNDALAVCIAVQQPHMRFVPKNRSSSRTSRASTVLGRDWSIIVSP